MQYTESLIRRHIAQLNYTGWDWGGVVPGPIRADLKASNPHVGRTSTPQKALLSFQEELAEYCWAAYSKALRSRGHMVIGRVNHLNNANLYAKVADIVGGGTTLFDAGTEGNLLQMDKWARVVNDAWILGGVHRRADFRLASPRRLSNLWNTDGGFFVVTAREILGLVNFGFEFEDRGPWQFMVSRSYVKSTTADLVKYERLIQRKQSLRTAQTLVRAPRP